MRSVFTILIISLLACLLNAQDGRKVINIPDITGYKTLKCDFHMHTIFSDGLVWPTVRVEEAWKEGLDAIAITDHIEYLPHKENTKHDHNTSYNIAKKSAENYGIILIRGTEITKKIPPGHFNAIFTEDNNKIENEDYKLSIKEAIDQGAFVMWNHPGWKQKDEIPIWYKEHEELYKKGWMHGMEIVNYGTYYPLAQEWCDNKNITMTGNSDIHNPINMEYDMYNGDHRPMTLVFAEEKSEKAIKEALFAGRTAVYNKDKIYGKEEFLKPLFDQLLQISPKEVTGDNMKAAFLVKNTSEIPVKLKSTGENNKFEYNKELFIEPGKEIRVSVNCKEGANTTNIELNYSVENFIVNEGKKLNIILVHND